MLQVIRYSETPNFGDDLNDLVWRNVLPPDVMQSPDTVMFGIGTILNQDRAEGLADRKRVFVLGSGAGYAALPAGWERYNFIAVRGPLTAGFIGKPEAAVTDGAILLASIAPGLPFLADRRRTGKTLFIPHHATLEDGAWQRVSEQAGMVFVDPRWDLDVVLGHFADADLVVCEAMHGAIVADTLRIPWIPLTISRRVLPFKWHDWTRSMELKYEPVLSPASSAWERIQQRGRAPNDESYDLQNLVGLNAAPAGARRKPRLAKLRPLIRALGNRIQAPYLDDAARRLQSIAAGPSYLSSDSVFADRLARMQQACAEFARQVRNG